MADNRKIENTNVENKQELNKKDLKDVIGGRKRNNIIAACPYCGSPDYDINTKRCLTCGHKG